MSHDAAVRDLLKRFEPSSCELLDILRRRVDDSMLDEIAQADYGEDAKEHLVTLRRIHKAVDVAPVNWIPMEVLELIRWSRPNDPSWKPGSIGERGHLMRAFCCAVLLRTAAEPKNYEYFDGDNQTVIQLVDSAIELGDEIEDAVLRFLCWRLFTLNGDDCEYPFFAMAVLLLVTHLHKIDDASLTKLANWVVAEESRIRNIVPVCPDDANTWLLGLTFHNLCHDVWIRLTKEVLLSPSHNGMSPTAQRAITEVAQRLLGTSG